MPALTIDGLFRFYGNRLSRNGGTDKTDE